MKRVIVGLLLAVLLLAGCTPSTSLGSVAGYVYVREGTMPPNAQQADIRIQSQANPPFGYQPLANAQVSVRGSGVATSTNQSGFFRITGVTPGMRVVLVEHSWLRESIERVVEVHSDRTTYLTYGDAVIAGVGWYVLIGIENYQYLDRSRGAVADAERMYDVLLTGNRMGGSAQLLLDAQATKANIRYWIEEAARRADPHDYLVVYFSGRSDSVVWGEGLDHIVPYDGRIHGENPDHTLISDGELRDWLAPFPGRDVTVLIDASYAGTFIDGNVTYAAVGSQALRRFGFTVLAAAGAEEEATYNPAFGHSVFTYFLVRGLETGQADANRDGKIRASELYAYVRDEMASFFGGSAQRHRPQLYQGSGDPVLFRLP